MRSSRFAAGLLLAAVCFGAGLFLRPSLWPEPAAPAKPIPFPMEMRAGANAWLASSAEYRACCETIYKLAGDRLEAVMKQAPAGAKPPAVVMDLDETVLDNSAFQTVLYQQKQEFSENLWKEYERGHSQDVGLVAGAKAFIERAEALGLTAVYISNRNEENIDSAIQAVERNGLNARGLRERLYLKPKGGKSEKETRRRAVAEKYEIKMILGDNLRDISEEFAFPTFKPDDPPEVYVKAVAERLAQVDANAKHWGVDWVALPNPVYGEWDKVLINQPPSLFYRPTSMKPAP